MLSCILITEGQSLACGAVEVVLEDDLRDACKPGDRVAICGIYKPVAPRANGSVSGALMGGGVAVGGR